MQVVYKRYASLYFVMGIDQGDNELITLEIIHHYVEVLDRYFGNVCELDLIFNFHKVLLPQLTSALLCSPIPQALSSPQCCDILNFSIVKPNLQSFSRTQPLFLIAGQVPLKSLPSLGLRG